MAFAFPRLSRWLWSDKERNSGPPSSSSTLSLSEPTTVRERDAANFQPAAGPRFPSTSRKVKREWRRREERKAVDKEYDMVLVPSDGECMSESESDDSDWSIGWLEPHAPEFQVREEEEGNSFAVLVPCYGRSVGRYGIQSPDNRLWGPFVTNLDDGFSAESKKHMEKWLSSLRDPQGFQISKKVAPGHSWCRPAAATLN